MFVRLKFAVDVTPDTVAVTVYGPPAVAFAVNVGDVATPFESVVAVAVADPLPKVPLAPVDGAVNVTVTPLFGVPAVDTVAPKALQTQC